MKGNINLKYLAWNKYQLKLINNKNSDKFENDVNKERIKYFENLLMRDNAISDRNDTYFLVLRYYNIKRWKWIYQ